MTSTAGPTTDPHDDARPFRDWMTVHARRIDLALERRLPAADSVAHDLPRAMRHAVLGAGKRVRPLLVLAAGTLVDAPLARLDACGCAVELIHAYSLVHDDMPCMDDDDLRRGQPTVHKAYGEAMALLAGDALQALAFDVLAEDLPARRAARMVRELAGAAGAAGMAGGQALDLHSVGHTLDVATLETMHRQKTGAMLGVSVRLGVLACDGDVPEVALQACERYSHAIGLAFQIVDDILDATADTATLGKTAGKDEADNKPTSVSVLGLDASRALAARLRDEAHAAIAPLGPRGQRLRELADHVVFRNS